MDYCVECGRAVGDGGGRCVKCPTVLCGNHGLAHRRLLNHPVEMDVVEARVRSDGYNSFPGVMCHRHRQDAGEALGAMYREIRARVGDDAALFRIVLVMNDIHPWTAAEGLDRTVLVAAWPEIAQRHGIQPDSTVPIWGTRRKRSLTYGSFDYPVVLGEEPAWRFENAGWHTPAAVGPPYEGAEGPGGESDVFITLDGVTQNEDMDIRRLLVRMADQIRAVSGDKYIYANAY